MNIYKVTEEYVQYYYIYGNKKLEDIKKVIKTIWRGENTHTHTHTHTDTHTHIIAQTQTHRDLWAEGMGPLGSIYRQEFGHQQPPRPGSRPLSYNTLVESASKCNNRNFA